MVLVLMCIFRATVSAVSCLVVPAFICIDLCASKINDADADDDDDDDEFHIMLCQSQRCRPIYVEKTITKVQNAMDPEWG